MDAHSEFNLNENLFLNTISNDMPDEPNVLYHTFEQNNIKVVNINSEDKLKLNESESEKKSEKKDKKII